MQRMLLSLAVCALSSSAVASGMTSNDGSLNASTLLHKSRMLFPVDSIPEVPKLHKNSFKFDATKKIDIAGGAVTLVMSLRYKFEANLADCTISVDFDSGSIKATVNAPYPIGTVSKDLVPSVTAKGTQDEVSTTVEIPVKVAYIGVTMIFRRSVKKACCFKKWKAYVKLAYSPSLYGATFDSYAFETDEAFVKDVELPGLPVNNADDIADFCTDTQSATLAPRVPTTTTTTTATSTTTRPTSTTSTTTRPTSTTSTTSRPTSTTSSITDQTSVTPGLDSLNSANAGCNTLTTVETCLASKDGRRGQSYSDSPCQWCCGVACTTNNAHKCEPKESLMRNPNYVGKSDNGLGENTCQTGFYSLGKGRCLTANGKWPYYYYLGWSSFDQQACQDFCLTYPFCFAISWGEGYYPLANWVKDQSGLAGHRCTLYIYPDWISQNIRALPEVKPFVGEYFENNAGDGHPVHENALITQTLKGDSSFECFLRLNYQMSYSATQSCEFNCNACSSPASCTECKNHKYLFNSNCVTTCPDGYYGSGSGATGRQCQVSQDKYVSVKVSGHGRFVLDKPIRCGSGVHTATLLQPSDFGPFCDLDNPIEQCRIEVSPTCSVRVWQRHQCASNPDSRATWPADFRYGHPKYGFAWSEFTSSTTSSGWCQLTVSQAPLYCGWAVSVTNLVDTSPRYGCPADECNDMAACTAKCNARADCRSFLYSSSGHGGYRCWMKSGSEIASFSTSHVVTSAWNLYVNNRHPACQATCAAYTCKAARHVKKSGSNFMSPADETKCCEPHTLQMRQGVATTTTTTMTTTMTTTSTTVRATCDSFPCSSDTINKGGSVKCLGSTAASCDKDTCCQEATTSAPWWGQCICFCNRGLASCTCGRGESYAHYPLCAVGSKCACGGPFGLCQCQTTRRLKDALKADSPTNVGKQLVVV